jgi:hypothetical protein
MKVHLASIVIAGHALNWKPEGVFIGVVAVVTALRIFIQKSTWWHHIMDWFIGMVAMSQVPQVNADVSKVTTQPWSAYGISAALFAITMFVVLGKK